MQVTAFMNLELQAFLNAINLLLHSLYETV